MLTPNWMTFRMVNQVMRRTTRNRPLRRAARGPIKILIMRSLVVLRMTRRLYLTPCGGPAGPGFFGVLLLYEGGTEMNQRTPVSSVSRITTALPPPIMGGRAPTEGFQAENSSYATDCKFIDSLW